MNESKFKEERTPDDLLSDFRGTSLFTIIIFTVVIHAVLLFGTSIPYLWKTVAGSDNSKLSEEERTENAIKAATASLRQIAKENGLKPQDLSNQLGAAGSSKSKPVKKSSDAPDSSKGPKADPAVGDPAPDPSKSAIEKELDVKTKGPKLPAVPEDDDLFK